MTTAQRSRNQRPTAQPATSQPLYELRLVVSGRGDPTVQVWQLPSPATPRLTEPEQVAALRGQAWRIVEPRVLRRLAAARIAFNVTPNSRESWRIEEDLALNLGLLFRTLAPMRNLDRIRQTADGIDAMSREEAGYWLGMAMHRKRPRRVLAALRMLLTDD
jgi:hypothetical protein